MAKKKRDREGEKEKKIEWTESCGKGGLKMGQLDEEEKWKKEKEGGKRKER